MLLFSVCGNTFVRATDQPALTALELAKRIDSHYNRLQSLKANFTEQYEGLGIHKTESGVMLLRKPGRMRWDYSSIKGKLFVLDGKYAWFYTPGAAQVQRMKAGELDDLRSPLRFLLGHTKIESELSGLKAVPWQESDGSVQSHGFTLSGVPKGQQKRIAKVSIKAKEDGTIEQLEIDETDGAQTTFQFSNEQSNPPLQDSLFRFTPPNGVPVVDALSPV